MVLRDETIEIHVRGEATTEQEVMNYFGQQNEIDMVADCICMPKVDY